MDTDKGFFFICVIGSWDSRGGAAALVRPPLAGSIEPTRRAGLGLAIVRGFVEAHHGTVDVTSEVGTGSLFSFVIPCLKDDPATHAAAVA